MVAENFDDHFSDPNRVGTQIVDAALTVHSTLGPGLLEGAYELCLAHELSGRHLRVQSQICIPIRYQTMSVQTGYRIDLLVNDIVVVELKAIEAILPVHRAQLLSYLRLGGFRLGCLLNFNVARMRDGIFRLVNGL